MVYLNLYIAHVQLILNCLGTGTVWPEFITGAFINSFCWFGCTKRLWGRETWVSAEKLMSRGLRAWQDSHLFHRTWVQAPEHTAPPQAQDAACECLLWAAGEVLSVPMSWEATHVLHPGQLLGRLSWPGMSWKLAMFCSLSVPTQLQQKATPELQRTAIPQHIWATEPGAFWFNETSRMFVTVHTLSPRLRPAEIPCRVSLQYLQILPSLSTLVLYSFFLLLLCLMFIYTHSLRSSMWSDFLYCTFLLSLSGILLSVFCQWSCTQGSRRSLTQV